MPKLSIATLAGTAALLLAQTADASIANVRIVNNSPVAIVEIYTSPIYRGVYGDIDVLGADIIRAGRSMVVDFDVPDANDECLQDIKAVGRDRRVWRWRMNVCRETSWTLND